jgi:hypothetical protein
MSYEAQSDQNLEEVAITSVSSQCLDLVEQYRSNQTTKGETIYKLVQTIPPGEAEAAESPQQTLESYISMLDDWD